MRVFGDVAERFLRDPVEGDLDIGGQLRAIVDLDRDVEPPLPGERISQAHLTHLNPFPANLGEVLARHPRVVVPELNLGQLSRLLRAEYLVDARSITKVQGVPFTSGELESAFLKELDQ